MARKKHDGWFPITSLHRDDIETIGYNASRISNRDMNWIAKRMANGYLDDLFWIQLRLLAEELGLPKRRKPKGGK